MKSISIVGTMRIEFDGTVTVNESGLAIVGIADDALLDGVALLTAAAPHGLTAADDGRNVTITGSSVSAYNGVFRLSITEDAAFVATPTTQFVLRDSGLTPVAYSGDATGGTYAVT